MNLGIILSIGSAAMELVVGLLLWTLGSSRAYRSLRWFALCALGAAGLSATNVVFAIPTMSAQWVVGAARLGGLSAAVASASWLVYSRARRGIPALGGADRVLVVVIGAAGVLCLVPGFAYRLPLLEIPLPLFGLSYRIPDTTLFGPVFVVLMLAGLAASVRHLRHVGTGWGRGLHLSAVVAMIVMGLNDSLVTLGLIASPYLVDLSFVLLCLAVALETTETMTDTSLRLARHSALLQEQVATRTRELIDAREALDRSERLAGLGRLAAGVGHEINNPLSSVASNLEFALEELPASDADVREALGDALAGARRIAAVVAQLNVLTRRAPRPDAVTDVHAVLDRALARVEPELPVATTVLWEVEGTPWVVGDPEQLEVVVLKLLTNSAQAMASPQRPRRLTLGAHESSEGEVVLSVADTGEGIAPEHVPRLFEPFHSTKLGHGIGLGLAICHSIVESLGGRFEVDSALGRGTTIRVLLPRGNPPVQAPLEVERVAEPRSESLAARDSTEPPVLAEPAAAGDLREPSVPAEPASAGDPREPGQPPVPAAPSAPRGPRELSVPPGRRAPSRSPQPSRPARVLIVDDEGPVARSLARLLATHKVEVLGDSAVALATLLARGEQYDLVLCDLTMPSPTGAEIHAALESRAPEVARRVVFVTGGSIDAPARALLAREGVRYLIKPVDTDELRSLVDGAVAARAGGPRASAVAPA